MGPFGSSIKVETFVPEGVPVISGQHLNGMRLDDTVGYNFITPEHADRLKSANVQRGDVIFTHAGNIGQVAYIPADSKYERYVISQRQFYLRPDSSKVLPEFIVAYFKTLEGQHKLSANTSQVGVPSIAQPVTYLRTIEIPLPPLPEQRAIAHILGTLDDKIELNRRMSETLEQMARAIFKAWFVDFEPVRAKMEGRWRRGESLPGLPAHLYDLFPDRLVPSELGEIPEGWEVKHAGKLFDVAIGKTPPRKEHHWFSTDPRDIPWMSIKDLGQAGVFISKVSEYLTPAAVERFRIRRIPDGTVVLSFKLTVGRVAITDGEMLSNEAIAHFLPREGTFLSSEYLYCYLRTFDYESLGSTSSIATAVNSDSVRAIPLLIPVSSVHDGFLRTARPLFLRLRALQRESRTLAALRDALLPKLIRGEVRVKDAERFLKERGL
jgi:type I restriction enzyme S subunit